MDAASPAALLLLAQPSRARGSSVGCRPSAVSRRERRARRARSETAPARRRHAGNPPAPKRARHRDRAPRSPTPQSRDCRPRCSCRRAPGPSLCRRRRWCASSCGCPPRARSWRSSTSFHVRMLDARRTRLAWGAATLLSSHAEHPDQRRATQQEKVRPSGSTASKRVSSPPGRDPHHLVGRHRHPRIQTASLTATAAVHEHAHRQPARADVVPMRRMRRWSSFASTSLPLLSARLGGEHKRRQTGLSAFACSSAASRRPRGVALRCEGMASQDTFG